MIRAAFGWASEPRFSGLRVHAGLAVMLAAVSFACTSSLNVPTTEQVDSAYVYQGEWEAEVIGNVAEIRITQPPDQLRRGGTLWAKVGPYIFLFSQETRDLFERFNGLAAVRVVTTSSRGEEVARALLHRDELNGITWGHALTASGRARRDGSTRPSRIEDLVNFGEEHTEFQYAEKYVR